MTYISVATEDELSEAVGIRLAREVGFEPDQLLRRGGFGYLRSSIGKFQKLAQLRPVLVLTDLDDTPCPSQLIEDWIGKQPSPPNLLFRVVVREIESWLLADHEAIRTLLGEDAKLPRAPDELLDPKRELLRLAQHAPRAIRNELIASRNSIASQGLGYNTILRRLVDAHWDPLRASERSPSLASARRRIREGAGLARR